MNSEQNPDPPIGGRNKSLARITVVGKIIKPQSPKDSKDHKEILVNLCVAVPW
jgi:hypothetical protein